MIYVFNKPLWLLFPTSPCFTSLLLTAAVREPRALGGEKKEPAKRHGYGYDGERRSQPWNWNKGNLLHCFRDNPWQEHVNAIRIRIVALLRFIEKGDTLVYTVYILCSLFKCLFEMTSRQVWCTAWSDLHQCIWWMKGFDCILLTRFFLRQRKADHWRKTHSETVLHTLGIEPKTNSLPARQLILKAFRLRYIVHSVWAVVEFNYWTPNKSFKWPITDHALLCSGCYIIKKYKILQK